MASITILNGHKNFLFAAKVKEETGASFEEGDQLIVISNSPDLVIPRYCFSQVFDPDGSRCQRGDPTLEMGWRSLLLNRQGYLRYFADGEFAISDDPPAEKRPAILLHFRDVEEKALAKEWAERLEFPSLTSYIRQAITAYNQMWRERAGDEIRAEESA